MTGSRPVGVLRFPGTNCDRDVFRAMEELGYRVQWLWHDDLFDYKSFRAIVLPGGFSYGDYLRAGALASRSRAMSSVREGANRGLPVLGICNGFQVLCESGLLPGALVRNQGLRFIDRWLEVSVEQFSLGGFGAGISNEVTSLRLPIAHADGRFYADDKTLDEIEQNGQVWLRYVENPNGSARDIAGVRNASGNVIGLMPHPERAMHDWMGSTHGRLLLSLTEET